MPVSMTTWTSLLPMNKGTIIWLIEPLLSVIPGCGVTTIHGDDEDGDVDAIGNDEDGDDGIGDDYDGGDGGDDDDADATFIDQNTNDDEGNC